MNSRFRFLKNVEFLSCLSDEDIHRVEAVCHQEAYRPGELIFAEGAHGHHFFIIIRGSVEIWKNYGGPEQELLSVFHAGQFFGELALIDDFPRSATVVSRGESVLLSIRRDHFHEIVKGSASVSFSMMKSLSALLRDRTESYVEDLRERNRHLEKAYTQLKREIEDRRLAERQLHHQAFHDNLTGLPNRALFLNRLQGTMEKARRLNDYGYAVLYLDIDRFSVINESFGHVTGDDILVQVAERLKNCIRRTETLARFSGDEFALIIEGIHTSHEATLVAQRIKTELNAPFIVNGKDIFISVSTGIVPGNPRYESTVDVLRDADIAMYGAKARGISEYQIYDEILHDKTVDLLRLETDLRGAAERGEFILKYQPIVSLKTCEIVGMEALVRWIHPERGMISPEVFVPIAERTGTIVPMGQWVLEEACMRMQGWLQEMPGGRPIYMNVNISGKQFMQPDFMTKFQELLQRVGIPGNFLRVELTESVLIDNVDYLAGLLDEARRLGIRIAIDDFGTGYSSLSYLHKFPIDVLKIDRSFIRHMGEDNPKDLVPIIISIAHSMNMEVVAEGVENVRQLNRLREYGCEYGQGFLFSKPLEFKEVSHFLTHPDEGMCLYPSGDPEA